MIRWCVVGIGWVAKAYVIPGIEAAANAEVVATLDKGDSTSEPFDAVYIATPNDSHAALTIQYAQLGKHVLCEKPMARSFSEAADYGGGLPGRRACNTRPLSISGFIRGTVRWGR